METIHVLVVSDCIEDVGRIKDVLSSRSGDHMHYHIEETSDFFDALKLMVRNTHDVYVLDQKFPNTSVDGMELLRRANAGGCSRPAILLTSMSDEEIDWAVDDVGAAGFLNRYVDIQERIVKHAIRYAVRHFKHLQEIQEKFNSVQKQLLDVGRKLNRGR